jgi:hypothetical protein
MCYNFQTSVVSFIAAMVSGLAAIYLKQYILGFLILCYGQIQLSEVFIWRGLEDNNINLNRFGTAYGKYLLPAHNLAIGLGIYLHNKDMIPLMIGGIFYFVVLILYSLFKYSDTTNAGCGSSCSKFAGKLQWPYPYYWYIYGYIISVILLYIYIKPFYSKIFIIGIFTLTLLVSYMLDYNKAIGSFWCWSAAILAPVIVIINTLLIKKYGGRRVIS